MASTTSGKVLVTGPLPIPPLDEMGMLSGVGRRGIEAKKPLLFQRPPSPYSPDCSWGEGSVWPNMLGVGAALPSLPHEVGG